MVPSLLPQGKGGGEIPKFSHEELYSSTYKSAFDRFKTRARSLIINIIFDCYPTQRGLHTPWFCPLTGTRLCSRHPRFNPRVHNSILEDYCDIMISDGLVPGVGGLPWATTRRMQVGQHSSFCFRSLVIWDSE